MRMSPGSDGYIGLDENAIVVGMARVKPSANSTQSQLVINGADCGTRT